MSPTPPDPHEQLARVPSIVTSTPASAAKKQSEPEPGTSMPGGKILVYFLRRDLRVTDNPIFHHLASTPGHGFAYLLPVYVFGARQIELSGFLKDGETSPYPEARSQLGKFWRTGPHRAKFTGQSVWDLKENLEEVNSGLAMRVGKSAQVLKNLIENLNNEKQQVGAVWMTEELSHEEVVEQDEVAAVCSQHDVDFKLWTDEKYFVDDRDTGMDNPQYLPDVFTAYRKIQEPLLTKPRQALPRPASGSLPRTPIIPPQEHPFVMAESLEDLLARLAQPLKSFMQNPPQLPRNSSSAHPFRGGETAALYRVKHLTRSGAMTRYSATRNGLLGLDFSTKLAGFLSLGCITARKIHEALLGLENGTDTEFVQAAGYGQGENEGTRGIRYELLWRDYMRLCTRKFGRKLFALSGFREDEDYDKKWLVPDQDKAAPDQDPSPEQVTKMMDRFLNGTTGIGLVDASQRELCHTGYTSNRARQNVASYFSKHLGIDWRYGAEWYECMLVDYDVSSNWANWQYVSGVGNDPRGAARTFNPVKQSFDYDGAGAYVCAWVPELKGLVNPENMFQVCTTNKEDLERSGLTDNIMATDPLKRIDFTVDHRPKAHTRKGWRPRAGRTYVHWTRPPGAGSGSGSGSGLGRDLNGSGSGSGSPEAGSSDGQSDSVVGPSTSNRGSTRGNGSRPSRFSQSSSRGGQSGENWRQGPKSPGGDGFVTYLSENVQVNPHIGQGGFPRCGQANPYPGPAKFSQSGHIHPPPPQLSADGGQHTPYPSHVIGPERLNQFPGPVGFGHGGQFNHTGPPPLRNQQFNPYPPPGGFAGSGPIVPFTGRGSVPGGGPIHLPGPGGFVGSGPPIPGQDSFPGNIPFIPYQGPAGFPGIGALNSFPIHGSMGEGRLEGRHSGRGGFIEERPNHCLNQVGQHNHTHAHFHAPVYVTIVQSPSAGLPRM